MNNTKYTPDPSMVDVIHAELLVAHAAIAKAELV